MKTILAFTFFLITILLASGADAQVFYVRLNINNTANNVYIPGVGEQGSGSLGSDTRYDSPLHFYLASYMSSRLAGLAAAGGSALVVNTGASNHSIQIEQDLQGSQIFLTFTRGNWQVMDRNINMIEEGKFLSQITPSFAYGLGTFYPIKLLLSYTNIDIIGDLILQRGEHQVLIENKGVSGGRPEVDIRRV